jgi:sialic acid synthase SpsE/RimJ/RimL family protein N-acetyltransferase
MTLDPQQISFECVQPKEEHARLIMDWRNDSETLKASFHMRPKKWESFYPEFLTDYFTIRELPPLFATHQGQRVAFLRFRPVVHPINARLRCCEISINVSPEHRKKGVAKAVLTESLPLIKQRGYDAVYAEIKEDNVVSQKVFTSAGYEYIGKAEKEVDDTKQSYSIFCYLAGLSQDSIHWKEVYIIAEAGSNWRMGSERRDLAMAKTLVEVAAEAGASAVKFQVFKPENVYVSNAGQSEYLSKAGIKENIFSIFQDLAMPYDMLPEIAKYCKSCGIDMMASPFSIEDFQAVDPFVATHKIASYELSHIRLIEQAARSGKPLILSTGAATESEIAWAVDAFYQFGGSSLTLLQCTAKYPADADSMNLRTIPWLQERFSVQSGLSDHSADHLHAPIAAVALGASVIEKHYTIDKRLPGPDHSFAINPDELKEMVHAIRETEKMLGSGIKTVMKAEEQLRSFARRGIQAIRPILAGEELREGVNIEVLRPGQQSLGMHPKYLVKLEGRRAVTAISAGEGVQTEHIEREENSV